MHRETIALHFGYTPAPGAPTTAVPVFQSAAYEFESADHAAALFNLELEGYRYSRISNPTTDVLERRVAAMEGGLQALCVSSGQAAMHFATANLAARGTNIVSVPQLYGTTYTLFAHLLPQMGVTVRFGQDDRAESIAALIDDDTRAVYCESVGNPAGNVCDIEALADVAHAHGVPLIVDNTVATPILLRPIEFGADVVLHSLTKFMGGHGTTMGGIIVDSGRFPWSRHSQRFPMFSTPDPSYHDLVYTEHFGAAAYIGRCRSVYQRTLGSVLSPLNAFLLLQGVESVALRMERHVANASRVAEFLRADRRVEWVNYAGFADSPYFALTQKYLGGRACSLLTFGIRGGFAAGTRFYDALKLIKRVVNLGDSKSLACHPASTTHRQMTPEQQARAGVTPEMIRLSIGIEHIDDILADLDQALALAGPARPATHDRGAAPSASREPGGPRTSREPLTIALVNNMADSALQTTERQFQDLFRHAGQDSDVRLRLFSFPEVIRSEAGRTYVAKHYEPIEELWTGDFDALVVTGAEPRTSSLADEVFWPSLTRLIDWAEECGAPTVWSCLAAHAAVLHISGIARRPFGEKLSGVFTCTKVTNDPIVGGLPASWRLPHSRHNTLDAGVLVSHGYEILSASETVGPDAFVFRRNAPFLFFQGHPEYDAEALFREYRRDVGRFLCGSTARYPEMPSGYFDDAAARSFAAFRARAHRDRRPELLADFPSSGIDDQCHRVWRDASVRMYANWLNHVVRAVRPGGATAVNA